ncbi:MAG: 50S ribosomal protein L23 [Patescibacteria group bacterium]
MNRVIKKAIITEKSFGAVSQNKYTFVVDKDASQAEIAEAAKRLFGVIPVAVNVANYKGKVKRTRRGLGRRSDFKKAIVTVKAGGKIDLFEVEDTNQQSSKAVKPVR